MWNSSLVTPHHPPGLVGFFNWRTLIHECRFFERQSLLIIRIYISRRRIYSSIRIIFTSLWLTRFSFRMNWFQSEIRFKNLTTHWERDPLTEVIYRPLKYPHQYDSNGDKRFRVSKPEEKGIDVLCALALVRETQNSEIDVVILASQDTDLVPALNEALAYGTAKIETCSWYASGNRSSREIRPEGARIWNTRLNQKHFQNSLDKRNYQWTSRRN